MPLLDLTDDEAASLMNTLATFLPDLRSKAKGTSDGRAYWTKQADIAQEIIRKIERPEATR